MSSDSESIREECIWCGQATSLSETHIFPQSIGGFIKPRLACSACNNFFGHSVENTVKKNIFFTAAIEKLNLASPKDAYSDVKKYDTKTGREVHLRDDGRASIVPGKVTDSHFIGDSVNAKQFFVKKLRNESPNFSVEPLEQFFDDPKRLYFDYIGKTYKKDMTAEKGGTIQLEGMTQEPDTKLIFKIAYEMLHLLKLNELPIINRKLQSLFTINHTSRKERITFSEELKSSVTSNAFLYRGEQFKAEQLEYEVYHFFALRLSARGLLYVEICFFGKIRTFFIIDQWDFSDQSILPYMNIVFVQDFDEHDFRAEVFPNLKYAERVHWSDSKIEVKYDGIVN